MGSFGAQDWAKGDRLWLGVGDLRSPDADCRVHGFRFEGKALDVYESDCTSWQNTGKGYDILLFLVALRNRTDRAVRFTLRDFVLVSRFGGASFQPVNVRSIAARPPAFLPETAAIAPHSSLLGWLTFDGRVRVVPARISYIDGQQVLTIRFEGRHIVR